MSENKENMYKNTLHLNVTDFPMRANAAQTDPLIQAQWEKDGILEKIVNLNQGNDQFVFHDGPPYANGDIHLGHAYNKILKDILCRSRRMMRYHVRVIPGWDCHGLPIEQKVATQSSATGQELKKECRAYAQRWVDKQSASFKKLGICMDWNAPYKTMDYSYEADIIRSFGLLVEKGYIKRTNKTVPWSYACKTALATAEIEYHERKDPSVYVLFAAMQNTLPAAIAHLPTVYFLVWTTTPWTLPLNRALLLKSDSTYCLVRSQDTYLIVGSHVVKHLSEVTGKTYEVISFFDSHDLKDIKVKHPFDLERSIPLVFDSSVGETEGTACVHMAPGCGPSDYEIGVKNGLEIYSPISDDGKYTSQVVPVALEGVHVNDGQIWVIKDLASRNLLWFKSTIKHSYPHCWRSKEGLIFRATPQWFFDLTAHGLKDRALSAIEAIDFIPEGGKRFLSATVGSRWEWCLSRQRAWGVPIPALVHEDGIHYWIDSTFIKRVADKVEEKGIEFWDAVSLQELKDLGWLPNDMDIKKYRKERDILDVWFESGVSHTAVLKKQNQFPADMYLEGIDQHRGWFQSSLLTSVALHDTAPMKAIMTHGFTVDAQGNKMSKSLGNVVSPDEIIARVGTDGLRLWVAMIGCEGDAIVSDTLLNNVIDVYRKMRNCLRFLLQNTSDYRRLKFPDLKLMPFDTYARQKTFFVYLQCIKAYQELKFVLVVQLLVEHISFLSSVYFDAIKDILYCNAAESIERLSAQAALCDIFDMLNHVIAPICVHMAEAAHSFWSEKTESVHLDVFPNFEFCEGSSSLLAGLISDGVVEKAIGLTKTDFFIETFDRLLDVRSLVMKELESFRQQKMITHASEAALEICFEKLELASIVRTMLLWFADKISFERFLADYFGVARVTLLQEHPNTALENQLYLHIHRYDGTKCPRCWKMHNDNAELCDRCAFLIR